MRWILLSTVFSALAGCVSLDMDKAHRPTDAGITRYARFCAGGQEAYGIVEGDTIHEIKGDLFGARKRTGRSYRLAEVKLLVPARPTKVLGMAGNYTSHLSTQPKPSNPELFFKAPSCLIGPGEAVVLPAGSKEVHLEGELVVVMGKRARNVSEAEALDYVLGVTCGNDISARDWQANDRQWWRAKGSDTFGPCGPFVVAGVNYDDLLLISRVNGQVTQQQRTSDMIFNCSQIVSFASRHVTLEPGDLIFTGTMGKTPAIKPGDVLEVEIEHVGVLRNPVVAEK